MFYSAITVLLYALIAACLIQPDARRFFAGFCFLCFTMFHELFFSELTGFAYYGSAALFDLAIIIASSGINPVPKLVLRMHRVCLVSMFVNCVGWVMWVLYYPPFLYNLSFVFIYIWALIIFIKRDHSDVGSYKLDSWISCFCFNNSTWFNYFNNNGGKI